MQYFIKTTAPMVKDKQQYKSLTRPPLDTLARQKLIIGISPPAAAQNARLFETCVPDNNAEWVGGRNWSSAT